MSDTEKQTETKDNQDENADANKKSTTLASTIIPVAMPLAGLAILLSAVYYTTQTDYFDANEFSDDLLEQLSEISQEEPEDVDRVSKNFTEVATFCVEQSATLDQNLQNLGLDLNPVVEFDQTNASYPSCRIKVDGLSRFDLNAYEINWNDTIRDTNKRDLAMAEHIQRALELKPYVSEFCASFQNSVIPALREAGVETDMQANIGSATWEDGCEINVGDRFVNVILPRDLNVDGEISEYQLGTTAERLLNYLTEDERDIVRHRLPELLPE